MNEELTQMNMAMLEKAVRVASLPAYRQFECFPPNVDIPFEIADDFANHCMWVLEGLYAPQLSNEQRTALIALNKQLDEMSGEEHAELWTEDALRDRPEWDVVREQARLIMNLFGWAADGPTDTGEWV
jgi:hypothetical protein